MQQVALCQAVRLGRAYKFERHALTLRAAYRTFLYVQAQSKVHRVRRAAEHFFETAKVAAVVRDLRRGGLRIQRVEFYYFCDPTNGTFNRSSLSLGNLEAIARSIGVSVDDAREYFTSRGGVIRQEAAS